jgi:hypothetical protein
MQRARLQWFAFIIVVLLCNSFSEFLHAFSLLSCWSAGA